MKSLNFIMDLEIRQNMENFYNTLESLSQRPKTYCTDFFNPKEIEYAQALLLDFPHLEFAVYGGSSQWERAVIFLGPYIDMDTMDLKDYVKIIRIPKLPDDLTHRDLLGALLHQGIQRAVIGDIIVRPGEADIICRRAIGEYLLTSLRQIKRYRVSPQELSENFVAPMIRNFDAFEIIAPSLRLDTIVASITRLSRAKAQELVAQGLVKTNYEQVKKQNEPIKIGDLLSIRKYGRFLIDKELGRTRKGNYLMNIKKYV